MCNFFRNIFYFLQTFPLEYPVYLRDHTNGMYRALVYFLCKSVAEIPIYVLTPFLYTIIMYWMVGKWFVKISETMIIIIGFEIILYGVLNPRSAKLKKLKCSPLEVLKIPRPTT